MAKAPSKIHSIMNLVNSNGFMFHLMITKPLMYLILNILPTIIGTQYLIGFSIMFIVEFILEGGKEKISTTKNQ